VEDEIKKPVLEIMRQLNVLRLYILEEAATCGQCTYRKKMEDLHCDIHSKYLEHVENLELSIITQFAWYDKGKIKLKG